MPKAYIANYGNKLPEHMQQAMEFINWKEIIPMVQRLSSNQTSPGLKSAQV